jgi:predicted Zn-dependent peptidase
MLFKGTERRSALDIARELDAVGGFANAFTSKEHVCFHAKVMESHLPLVADVLTDIFLNSVFEDQEIEREQQVILQEIRMIEDTPDEFVHILFQDAFWKGNPLGLPIYGTSKSVSTANRALLRGYMSRTFHPERVVVSAAGNLDHDRFLELVAPALEGMKHDTEAPDRATPDNSYDIRVIPKDLEQVHICFGLPGTSQVDDNRFAGHLLNVVLGGGMSSRLFQEIREKRGLAYSVYSFSNSHVDTGMLGVYAGVGEENVLDAVRLIYEQLALLADKLISESEISGAKEYLKGSMYLNSESTDSRMNRLAKNEFLFGRHVPMEEIERKIDQLTAEGVREWFRSVFDPRKLAVMLYGPVKADRGDIEKLIS